jgi:hypothetical protein
MQTWIAATSAAMTVFGSWRINPRQITFAGAHAA